MKLTTLKSRRLELKLITPQVIQDLFQTKNDESIAEFLGIDLPGLEHYREMHLKGMETHRISLRFFLLALPDSGKVIGECGFHSWNTRHNKAELFYALRHDDDKRIGT